MPTALSRWLDHSGETKAGLARAANIRWQTAHEIIEGRCIPRVSTARRISAATDGEVSVPELLGLRARKPAKKRRAA